MTILFRDYAVNKYPKLKFSPGLILGWLTTDRVARTETRYALYASGQVMQATPEPMYGWDFTNKWITWTKAQAVPDDAEFIGNYRPPV